MKFPFFLIICLGAGLMAYAQNHSDSAEAYIAKAAVEVQRGRTAVAYKYFQDAVNYDSLNEKAWSGLAGAAISLRQYAKARQSYQKVYVLNPKDTAAIHQLAVLNFNFRQWESAIFFAKMMQEQKIFGNANYIIGKSYYEQENYGQAFKYLDAAMLEEPANAQIPYIIALAYVDMSNYKKAVPYFLKALQTDSSNARWTYELAMTYAAIPDDKTAVVYYELAEARGYKTDNDFYENMSLSCILSGQAEKGIALMQKVLMKKPQDITLLYNIAETYYKINQYKEAIDYWDKVLQQDEKHSRALYMSGVAYQKKGETTKGKKLCEQAIAMDPSLSTYRRQKMDIGL